MNNVTFQDLTDPLTEVATTYAFVEIGDGGFTVMTKDNYEAQQVEHLTEIVASEAKTK